MCVGIEALRRPKRQRIAPRARAGPGYVGLEGSFAVCGLPSGYGAEVWVAGGATFRRAWHPAARDGLWQGSWWHVENQCVCVCSLDTR